MQQHDPGRYKKCMHELKHRIAIFDSAMAPFRKQNELAVPNLELALLQLRKCYELIAFASISANQKQYSLNRKRFEKDWRIAEIVKNVEKINPRFLPVGVRRIITDGDTEAPHELLPNGFSITSKELLSWHGRIGELMHASNPYSSKPQYLKLHGWACERRDHLIGLLSNHTTVIEFERIFYLCSMEVHPELEIQVSIFEIAE
ncbi:hypothetical protein EH31_15150 [Erythrobacter longus]|uniref:Uncharacterized protein n=1 Tax=Erythrobacter longus TaxID=1044 RepID=A0A074M2S3_ERYLO|nr:hypothetical protein [Erythrobacter longus]KEO88771.1 hypothetical protein EH31_15150 [Erythrobacter longus]